MLLIRSLRLVKKNHDLGRKPISLYAKIKFSGVRFVCSFQNVQVYKARRSLLHLHHFVNAIERILFGIFLNLHYSSFDSRYA